MAESYLLHAYDAFDRQIDRHTYRQKERKKEEEECWANLEAQQLQRSNRCVSRSPHLQTTNGDIN